MNQFFTLKRIAFLCLVLFGSVTAFSQTCTGVANTGSAACVPVTDQFNTASFNQNPIGGFSYASGSYSIAGNGRGNVSITSYTLQIKNNNFSVGASITSGANRFANTATIEILNAATNAVICQATVTIQASGCLSATFSGLSGQNVKAKFIFNKTGNGGTTFDNFGVDPAQAFLPVNFVGFEGKKVANGTQLTWKVAGESNVKEYEVERSTTGNSGFAKIGSVPATGSDTYTFTDAASHSSAVFYRIKNVDNDGKFKYSTILSFRNGAGSVMFKVAPTVVNSKTVVQHNVASGATLLTLSTADGRVVRNIRPAAGSMQTDVDMSGLSAGLYLLKYTDGTNAPQLVKLVKE